MNDIKLDHTIVQYPTELRFSVLDIDVRTYLTILKSRSVSFANVDIEFAIIGESHCITVMQDNKLLLQEVLACTDMPQLLQAESHKFAKLETYCYQQLGYQSRVWFTDEVDKALSQADNSLRLVFPEVFGQTPFTEIAWTIDNHKVTWCTVHFYPLNNRTIYVYSETTFDLNERSNNV